jgi:hypothetical protein
VFFLLTLTYMDVGKPELIQMGAERFGTGKTALLRSNLGSSTPNAVHK